MSRPVLLLALIASTVALADNPLAAGDQSFHDLDFETAATLYKQALTQPGSRDERLRAYRGLALSSAFMGDAKAAKANFERVLQLDPSATVDATLGPKILAPFESAKKSGRVGELTAARDEQSGALTVRLDEDLPLSRELRAWVRVAGSKDYRLYKGPSSAPLVIKLPAASDVEAYLQGVDVNEGVLYATGSASSPVRLRGLHGGEAPLEAVEGLGEPAAEAEPTRIPWPVWVGVGVGVAAAGVGAYVLLGRPAGNGLPEGRSVQLPVLGTF